MNGECIFLIFMGTSFEDPLLCILYALHGDVNESSLHQCLRNIFVLDIYTPSALTVSKANLLGMRLGMIFQSP